MTERGRYKLVRKIADGGMAEIYLGVQHGVEGFERPVVLKGILGALLTDPRFKNMMIDEAHVAMTLLHSNIVQVLDLGQAKGRYYLVLEFVDGWDLNNILRRLGNTGFKLMPELALFIAAEVCRALAYAHGKKRNGTPMGIVHRDVTPHNVLVSTEGEVKLTDFGIAKALVRRENTLQGVIKGKVAFMSPEQASGAAIDARSDLFAVGTILYQMTTGRRPFEAPTDLELLLRVQKGEFPSPATASPAIAPGLSALIMKTMSFHASDRFQTADEMLGEIESLHRSAFPPAGKTEFKRWLAELERLDGIPPIGHARVPTARPHDTVELVDEDIEFESDGALLPTEIDIHAHTVSLRSPASPGEITTRPKSRRAAGVAIVLAGIGGALAWVARGRNRRLPFDGMVSRLEVDASAPDSLAPSPDAGAPSTIRAADSGAPEGVADPDEDEEGLLQAAEPGIASKIIGEDPEDAVKPAPGPRSSAKVPDKRPRTAKPPAAAPIVSVHVVSKPAGAVVRLKKRVFGRAPIDLRFRAGITYELNFIKRGYLPVSKRVMVTRRPKQILLVALRKRPAKKKGIFQRLFGR